MIRYNYVKNQILKIYSALSKICFPLDINEVINIIPNCRYMSYQKFAEINKCNLSDIIHFCESKSGCTHYNISNDRYLILYNNSIDDNNLGRQLWTCAHEVGHIICKHHEISAFEKLAENSLLQVANPEFEAEADYFAGMLLSPFPLFKLLDIKSSIDVQNTFGLSCEASNYRYKQYQRWLKTRVKTAWENDMIKIYKEKEI